MIRRRTRGDAGACVVCRAAGDGWDGWGDEDESWGGNIRSGRNEERQQRMAGAWGDDSDDVIIGRGGSNGRYDDDVLRGDDDASGRRFDTYESGASSRQQQTASAASPPPPPPGLGGVRTRPQVIALTDFEARAVLPWTTGKQFGYYFGSFDNWVPRFGFFVPAALAAGQVSALLGTALFMWPILVCCSIRTERACDTKPLPSTCMRTRCTEEEMYTPHHHHASAIRIR